MVSQLKEDRWYAERGNKTKNYLFLLPSQMKQVLLFPLRGARLLLAAFPSDFPS